jgi:Putative MetA-pathway of phenol degradation
MLKLPGLFLFFLINLSWALENICDSRHIMNLIDRPTFAKGACVMPEKELMFEYGASHYKFINEGEANGIGEAEFRFGLIEHTELDINAPTYFHQSINPKAGFGYTSIGLKSLVFQDTHQAFTIDAGIIPSGGSAYFGSRNTHGYGNLIGFRNITEKLSNAFVFGYANFGEYNETDFENYSTFIIDYAISYTLNEHYTTYMELTSQTKSNYNNGLGILFSTGFIYMLSEHATVDIEFTQRVLGELNHSTNTLGIGGAIKF